MKNVTLNASKKLLWDSRIWKHYKLANHWCAKLLQVSQLMILTETRGNTPFPDLTPSACTVMEAVQSLASVAQKVTTETADEVKLHHCNVFI